MLFRSKHASASPITYWMELADPPDLIDTLIAQRDAALNALNDLLNDCINFDDGNLTPVFQESASALLKRFE